MWPQQLQLPRFGATLQQLPLWQLEWFWLNNGSPHAAHWLFVHRWLFAGQSLSRWQGQCA
jgi:hypothetical protein